MTVTFCAYDAVGNIDGPSAWIKRLLPWLNAKGVDIRVIFFADRGKNLPVFNYLQRKGIRCKVIFWDVFHEKKVHQLLHEVQESKTDVFIANYFPVAALASKWIKDAGIPTVLVLHNDDAFHYGLVKEFAQTTDSFSAVVSVSKNIQLTVKPIVNTGILLLTIPCGAPLAKSGVEWTGATTMKVIYAGRLDEKQKKISEVALAFCTAAKDVPGTEYIIYGSGPEKNNVLSIIEKHGAGLPVRYGGAKNSEEILQCFLQNHVFVLLSEYEGIPISLMEAMGCGLVPVCTQIKSGVLELVQDQKTGILVNDRKDDFVTAIKKLRGDQELYNKLSANARKLIIEEYAEEICNQKWLDLLNVLANTGVPGNAIEIPPLQDLKKYKFPKEISAHQNPIPPGILIPFYKARKVAGRLKRIIWKKK